jgi:23S rRNA (adenine2503-C2)-methyltransferase
MSNFIPFSFYYSVQIILKNRFFRIYNNANLRRTILFTSNKYQIMNKIKLVGKTLDELKIIVSGLGMPTFTAKQISEWLYKKRAFTIDEMTNISIKNRLLMTEEYEVGRNLPIKTEVSNDGTKKYLFKTDEGHFIETVYIPEDDRSTLCVSSQVGCKMGCKFCMTGQQGFVSQLTSTEILNQILSIPEADSITNLVFMGMGEPFDNTLPLLRSLDILTADYGYAWSPRRITVSTIGLIPGIKVFMEKSNCHLTVSLHSPFSKDREELMPIEKTYPISKVLEELRKYDFSKQRRVSFAYILFDGINDAMRDAVELVKILKGIDCRVNLVRYHAIPNVGLKASSEEKMNFFRDYLTSNGVTATIRHSRGEDISAACGLLSTLEKA